MWVHFVWCATKVHRPRHWACCTRHIAQSLLFAADFTLHTYSTLICSTATSAYYFIFCRLVSLVWLTDWINDGGKGHFCHTFLLPLLNFATAFKVEVICFNKNYWMSSPFCTSDFVNKIYYTTEHWTFRCSTVKFNKLEKTINV